MREGLVYDMFGDVNLIYAQQCPTDIYEYALTQCLYSAERLTCQGVVTNASCYNQSVTPLVIIRDGFQFTVDSTGC